MDLGSRAKNTSCRRSISLGTIILSKRFRPRFLLQFSRTHEKFVKHGYFQHLSEADAVNPSPHRPVSLTTVPNIHCTFEQKDIMHVYSCQGTIKSSPLIVKRDAWLRLSLVRNIRDKVTCALLWTSRQGQLRRPCFLVAQFDVSGVITMPRN
jgi:hypothetical protein